MFLGHCDFQEFPRFSPKYEKLKPKYPFYHTLNNKISFTLTIKYLILAIMALNAHFNSALNNLALDMYANTYQARMESGAEPPKTREEFLKLFKTMFDVKVKPENMDDDDVVIIEPPPKVVETVSVEPTAKKIDARDLKKKLASFKFKPEGANRATQMELPYLPSCVDYSHSCQALQFSGGLFSPCLTRTADGICKSCATNEQKTESKYGTIQDREDTESDKRFKRNKISYGTWCARRGVSREFVESWLKENAPEIVITEEDWVVNTKAVRAPRKKKSEKSASTSSDEETSSVESLAEEPAAAPAVTEEPAAAHVATVETAPVVTEEPAAAHVATVETAPVVTEEPAADPVATVETAPVVTEEPVTKKKEKKEEKAKAKAEKEAEKAKAKAEKEAEKAKAKAIKEAEKAKAKAEKEAKKEEKAKAKAAEKEAKKEEKAKAKKEVKKEEKAKAKAEKEVKKEEEDQADALSDEEEEDEFINHRFSSDGKNYGVDSEHVLFEINVLANGNESYERVGTWDPESKTPTFH